MTVAPTIAQALADATAALAHLQDADARLDAEVLLSYVLGHNRAHLHAWPDKMLTAEQQGRFCELVAQRAAGQPIAYLTGRREFWSLELQVTPDTLIPRPETELLVELALARIPREATWRIADLGTGSGTIALAIASERPHCQVVAVERSTPAVAVARSNARRLGIENVEFIEGAWMEAFATGGLDLVASNPPYIEAGDPHLERGDVCHEPRSALTSGIDGLDDIRIIVEQATRCLRAGGWLLLEHGYQQGPAVVALLKRYGYRQVEDCRDLAGQGRVACAQWG